MRMLILLLAKKSTLCFHTDVHGGYACLLCRLLLCFQLHLCNTEVAVAIVNAVQDGCCGLQLRCLCCPALDLTSEGVRERQEAAGQPAQRSALGCCSCNGHQQSCFLLHRSPTHAHTHRIHTTSIALPLAYHCLTCSPAHTLSHPLMPLILSCR